MTHPSHRIWRTALLSVALCTTLIASGGCKARKDFPEGEIGWHNPSFTSVYGTLQKIRGATDEDPPTWVVLFSGPQGPYQGMLALTPPVKLTGYSGGERVELRGHVLTDATTDAYNGRWYVVDSIQLWVGHR